MSKAGDMHIWKVGEFPPVAECGYTPEIETIKEDDAEIVQPVHVKPTGLTCEKCTDIVTPAVAEVNGAAVEEATE